MLVLIIVRKRGKPNHLPQANPQGSFFKGRIPHSPGYKESAKPRPVEQQNCAKTPPQGNCF